MCLPSYPLEPAMTGVSAYRAYLEAARLLPEDAQSAFCIGSVARGWANPGSDYDISIVTTAPHRADGLVEDSIPLDPDVIPIHVGFADGRRWEIKYWTDDQVGQMLAKVSGERFDSGRVAMPLTAVEEVFLEGVLTCLPVTGEEWIARRRADIGNSAYREFVVARSLSLADGAAEDAIGQLAAADSHSAVLSARYAVGHTVDALLESCGCYGSGRPKWRARRMQEAVPAALPFARYWAMETMAGLDRQDPGQWVRDMISWCKQMAMEVEF